MERNRLTITTESRILGDEYVRFGGEYIETCSPQKREQGALCLAIAGQVVSLSSDRLHISVKFDGEELNPLEFLTMLYGNIKALKHQGRIGAIDIDDFDMNIATQYDNDREEIESLMLRYLPLYMDDLRHGQYALSPHREQSLRNIFSLGAMKRYFFEVMPSMSNPLGISQRSVPLACKVQNLLIGDFLDYLALRHNVFLSTLNEALKKKSTATS